jgi:PAS domain S-box-containing protein
MTVKKVNVRKVSENTPKTGSQKAMTKQMGSLEKFRRMATVIQDSNDAITFQDLEGNILAWNRGAEIIYGYSQAEALRMNIVDTVPKEYQEEARGFLTSLKRGELLPNLETKRKHKDGRIIDVWLTNTKLTDDKGKLTGIATTERDITEQTRTLEKFRRMATVIQDSNDAITFQDLDGNILAWNQGAEQIYGYSETEALSMNIVDTVPKEYQEEAREFLSSLKRGELVPTLETKRKTKDGRIIDVWLTNTKLTDDKGKLTGIATTERDITERKHSEASLREKFRELDYLREGQIALSERMRGEQIISRLGQSILSHLVPFTNAQVGAFYLVIDNKKLQMVSGYALAKSQSDERIIEFGEGLVGQVALEKQTLLVGDVPPSYFTKIESGLGTMIPQSLLICPILYENEVTGVIELGSLHPFTEHQRAFLSHVSENIGIAINTSDVRKKLQKQNEALNKAQVLLEEKANEVQRASQYKTEFLANMSHELRTPLNSSLILAKLLMNNSRGNLTEEQIQFATSIYSSGNDLLNLINDILDLSKVEAGKLDIRVEKLLIRKVIEEVKQTFQPLAREKKLVFEVQYDRNLPQAVATDRQRLNQILKNLISNAIKFTDSGFVKVRLHRVDGDSIAIEVKDSGIGIPKEQHGFIFEAFRQADGTTNRKYGGTGLGLSISRDLAKLLGGRIEVESSAGKGSCFTLIIPETLNDTLLVTETTFGKTSVSYNHFKQALAYSSLPFDDDRHTLTKDIPTILVIEDDLKFAKILLEIAHARNFKCVIAQGADEGYAMALEYNPHAIILDIVLPDHVGLTALDRLKENPKTRHIPVQVISIEDRKQPCLEMGAIGFMLKPVKHEEIEAAFAALTSRYSKTISRVLIVEDDDLQRDKLSMLISDDGIEITQAASVTSALRELQNRTFDCILLSLKPFDESGCDLMEPMVRETIMSFPPIIIFAADQLNREQEFRIRVLAKSVVIKRAKSHENVLAETTLILHRSEAKMPPAQQLLLKTARSNHQAFEGKKILLVDDDIRNIFALTSALEQKGATIYVGRNGQEALENLDRDPDIDLVLMDIMMPEMDGYEATKQIRRQERFCKLPIIAVTAKAMKDDQNKCIEAGANDYVSKPVDVEKLLSLIRVWMP